MLTFVVNKPSRTIYVNINTRKEIKKKKINCHTVNYLKRTKLIVVEFSNKHQVKIMMCKSNQSKKNKTKQKDNQISVNMLKFSLIKKIQSIFCQNYT